jgi:hypothetical protein
LEVETKTPEENMKREETVENENELTGLKSKIGELEKEAAGKDLKINGLEAKLADIAGRQKETQDRLANAINSYRTLITGNNTEIPAELITGDSIEEIDSSMIKAKLLVGKIRQGLESGIAATRIPGGAPVRSEPDISGLSPIEKIKYAMNRSK